MAEVLIKYETIDKKQIDAIMKGKRPKKSWLEESNDKEKIMIR